MQCHCKKKKKKLCINCLLSCLSRCVNLEPAVGDPLVIKDTSEVENTKLSWEPDGQSEPLPSSEVHPEKFVKVPQSSSDCKSAILAAFDYLVHWQTNHFSLPCGNLTDQFIASLSELFWEYALGSFWEVFILTVAMLLPALILQRPHKRSTPTIHTECLQCRFILWETTEEINELLK